MIITKHVEHHPVNADEIVKLQIDRIGTTSKVDGVTLLDIHFPEEKDEFFIALDRESEENTWNAARSARPVWKESLLRNLDDECGEVHSSIRRNEITRRTKPLRQCPMCGERIVLRKKIS